MRNFIFRGTTNPNCFIDKGEIVSVKLNKLNKYATIERQSVKGNNWQTSTVNQIFDDDGIVVLKTENSLYVLEVV